MSGVEILGATTDNLEQQCTCVILSFHNLDLIIFNQFAVVCIFVKITYESEIQQFPYCYVSQMGPLNRQFTENTIPITKINRLILFRKIISVYCENHAKRINTLCEQNVEVFECYSRWQYCAWKRAKESAVKY